MLLFLCLINAEFTRQQNPLPEGKTLATDASDPANDCNLITMKCSDLNQKFKVQRKKTK